MSPARQLSVVAGVSAVYDVALGVGLLVATDRLAALSGVPVPDPRLFVTICGLLLTCVGIGYLQPMRDPERHRGYLWVFGPLLKGLGAIIFIVETLRGGPEAYLLFAATDGTLAVVTLAVLLRSRR